MMYPRACAEEGDFASRDLVAVVRNIRTVPYPAGMILVFEGLGTKVLSLGVIVRVHDFLW